MRLEIKTDKYIWGVTDQYGWPLEGSDLRDFNIDSVSDITLDELVERTYPNQVFTTIINNSENLMSEKSFINLFYDNGCITLKDIRFEVKFSDTDDFIDNLLRSNGCLEMSYISKIEK